MLFITNQYIMLRNYHNTCKTKDEGVMQIDTPQEAI